ncbi:MAG: hypothetical protein DCC49_09080 [Acidobacteria bacterium]|nr:MAG: hypothetical protein DCC49_09080 [Acidobacteriota bacterium]
MEDQICASCGASNPPAARYCMSCGSALGASCGVCGGELPGEARFCPSCGAHAVTAETGESGDQVVSGQGAQNGHPQVERRGTGRYTGDGPAPRRRASDPGPVRVGQIAATGVIQPGEERRVVTILFGDLSGFTALSEQHDPEEIKAALDATFRALGTVIEAHGGTVDKFIGDNIMATFGAPTAHEDDPERAVRAALAMRELLEERNAELEVERGFRFDMRIGINSGEVMAGRLGADSADAYTVMGDAVNVASRLEQAAEPGQILVGPETRQLCSGAINFGKPRKISLKGKANSIEAAEAIEAIGLPTPGGLEREKQTGRSSPFVGRIEEFGTLSSLARASRDSSRPYFVTVLGEPGVGKTRLLQETADRLDPEGFAFLWGHTAPYGGTPALTPVADMIRAACDVGDDDDVETARAKISERIADLTDESVGSGLSRRILEAIGLGPESGNPSGAREFIGAFDRFFEALAREGPLVLVFDDLHWASDELLDVVEGLPDRIADAPIVVFAVSRPILLEHRPEWGGGKRHAYTMQLEALSVAEAERFVTTAFGASSVSRSIVDLIVTRAGGNPLFLSELLAFLVSEEIVAEEDGEWIVEDEYRLEALPNNLRSMVAARLDAIPVDDKELLQLASVVGDTFWAGALASITGIPEADMAQPLARLVDADLLVLSGRPALSGEQEYRFRHGLTREAAYRTLPRARRARLHTLAGVWLEAHAGEGGFDGFDGFALDGEPAALTDDGEPLDFPMLVSPGSGMLEEIAYHYEQAAVLTEGEEERFARDRAFQFLERAAREAAERAMFLQAERLYRRAHKMAGPTATSLEGLGGVLFGLGRLGEAEQVLEDALDKSVADEDRLTQARILTRVSELRQRQSETSEAVDLADTALAIWREVEDPAGEADALINRGRIYVRTGRISEAFDDFAKAREIAAGLGNARQEAWALHSMAWCRFNAGLFGGARELIEESLLRFSATSEVEGIGSAVVLLGWIDTFDGRFVEPRETAEGLRRLAHETGEYWGEGLCATLECLTSANLGETLRARRVSLEALQILEDVEDRWGQALAGLYLGVSESALGRPREAVTAFNDALRNARIAGDPVVESSILYYWAWHLLGADDSEGAACRAIEAQFVVEELGARSGPWTGESLRLGAAIAKTEGFTESALALLEKASSPVDDDTHTHSLGRRRSLVDLAILQVELDCPEQALTSCDSAERLYSEDHESAVMLSVARGRALELLGKNDAAAAELESAWSRAMSGEDARLVVRAADALVAFREGMGDSDGAEAILEEAALYADELAAASSVLA